MNHEVDPSGDRLALVTGTTRGIGAAVAARLIDRGWNVVGIARHGGAIEHARYRHVRFDLADTAALAETIERELGSMVSDAHWRRIGLVNNAAMSGELGPVEAIDPVDLLQLSAVNWIAPVWLTGFLIRRADAAAAVRIVNVSSGAAVQAFAGLSAYCSSKAALRMAGMVIAKELDSSLRRTPAPRDTSILSYEPGIVDTDMQTAARTRPLPANPWGVLFRDFAATGSLVAPAAPAAEIVTFLESDGQPGFVEQRLNRAESNQPLG
ncbi:MAG TPA: SDR family NAD(P)-dependent oxidoreductase [Vicinamibacterales bacterium]|nr:SDR family NAD(P)-dependent oxidoreductase [Vicinamibacterales bacterium]